MVATIAIFRTPHWENRDLQKGFVAGALCLQHYFHLCFHESLLSYALWMLCVSGCGMKVIDFDANYCWFIAFQFVVGLFLFAEKEKSIAAAERTKAAHKRHLDTLVAQMKSEAERATARAATKRAEMAAKMNHMIGEVARLAAVKMAEVEGKARAQTERDMSAFVFHEPVKILQITSTIVELSGAAWHNYGPDTHSCAVLCDSLTGSARSFRRSRLWCSA